MENHTMMQDVYKRKAYPPEILRAVLNSGRLGIELANRWMLGWPESVQKLIAAGEYEAAFKYQLEQEIDALAESTATHLTPTEIIAVAGLAMGPPTIS
jgi:hypothetical protein